MIIIHSKEEFKKMHKAGKLAAQLLDELGQLVKPGITTNYLNEYAIEFTKKYNTKSADFGYKNHNGVPFPGYICTSINHVVCHGVPCDIILKEGDIIAIDVTLIVDEFHGDTCRTFAVGNITKEAEDLIKVTQQAMYAGIDAACDGNKVGDIGAAIQEFINKYNTKYSIVDTYCGHGIGRGFHTPPQITHTGIKNTGSLLKEGMFFTVEPMINLGKRDTRNLKDGWTVISKDYSLSAQFEHSVGIGENGIEIFTQL